MRRLLNWMNRHRRTMLTAALCLVFVLFLQIVFKEHQGGISGDMTLDGQQVRGSMESYLYGWPLYCVEAKHFEGRLLEGGSFEKTRLKWIQTEALFDLLACFALVCSLTYLSRMKERQSGSRRYTLSGLMALMFALAATIVATQELSPWLGLGGYSRDRNLGPLYDMLTIGGIACVIFAATWFAKNLFTSSKHKNQAESADLAAAPFTPRALPSQEYSRTRGNPRRELFLVVALACVALLASQVIFVERWQSGKTQGTLGGKPYFGESTESSYGWPLPCLHVESLKYKTLSNRQLSATYQFTKLYDWDVKDACFNVQIYLAVLLAVGYLMNLRLQLGREPRLSLFSLMYLVFCAALSMVAIQRVGPLWGLGDFGSPIIFGDSFAVLYDLSLALCIAAITFAIALYVKGVFLRQRKQELSPATELPANAAE